jgi:hypothetical protein
LAAALLRFFPSARLDEITVMDVDRYRQAKLGEGTLSADSINSKPHRAWLDRADHIVALLDTAGELDREAQPRCGHRRVLLAT